ncbi:MAG: SusD/RagB family nutrient-binding outer membrane lipoprotein [Tannerellaceae bacterium]|jgi:hypothetical protein|nr:SusD/RagB family nutrient-binding outer membrane lipoprotein [Tannerellaceae bacterium]
MKKYKNIVAAALAGITLFFTSCQEDFADINQDPAAVTQGNPSYLFAQTILEFEPSDYLYWFYNATSIFQWTQMAVSTGGVTSTLVEGAPLQSFKSINVLKYVNELKYVRSQMTEEESARYEQYAACMDILAVYMGIFDSDFIGDIPYTEGAQAIHGGTLTPKYDRVEDLYTLWLTSLDNDVKALTTATEQVFEASQDPIYKGNKASWAKLANSLKLKLAARMINVDRAKALQLASEVANSSAGFINSEGEDFLFNKAIYNSSSNDYTYHWENDVLMSIGGSKTVIDFMVDNRDPRVRFIYRKNHWNSKVLQAFFDAGRQNDVPAYIMENVTYGTDADGKYQFQAWKGAGEPWIRYQGFPLDFNAGQQAAKFGDWFNYGIRCRLENITYYPFSEYQKEMIYGRIDFRLPVAPGDAVVEDKEDVPWWGMYMTTAETNLYLAEFALLGANLPESAESYYNRALAASVKEYDLLAKNNKIPYYGTTYNYDPNEKVIDLQEGEIETMMAKDAYKLSGSKAADLEKVYLQQMLHFNMQPIDQYTTAKRSGLPKIGSTLFNRADYAANNVQVTLFPRRMALNAPAETDLMYPILIESYKAQGYTVGSGAILNSERTWQDQNNPQWGEGPKM